MSAPKTGGQAFPTLETDSRFSSDGITLRQYYAAKADISEYRLFDAFEMDQGYPPEISELAEYIAKIRFIEADAMIAEGEKEGGV